MGNVMKNFDLRTKAVMREIAMIAEGMMDDPDFPRCPTCGRTRAVKMSLSEPSSCQTTDSLACKDAVFSRGRINAPVKIEKI